MIPDTAKNLMSIKKIRSELRSYAEPKKIPDYQRFFKTGKGEYAEGDLFLGVTVPKIRQVAKKYSNISLKIVEGLLKSKFHEERLVALIILVNRQQNHNKIYHTVPPLKDVPCTGECKEIFNAYLKNTKYVNNWDLVDVSAHKIVGAYLKDKNKSVLYKLARSENLWEKRISIISTFWFIKNDDFKDALNIAEILLCDNHDLIHKAVGWVLREVGKKDRKVEEKFLKKHYKKMPRTMLRYAIEKFPESLRQKYLKGII